MDSYASMIPQFCDDGYLPEGLHLASEADITFRFGASTRQRRRLTLHLRRWIELARQIGAKKLLIDGSFVTKKEDPNDIDAVILLSSDFEQQIEDVIGRPVLIAASTRAGEEEKILGAYIRCIETIPDLLLVLVPRHPERFDSTAELCARHSLTVVKRSSNEKLAKNSHVFLGDSMGELALYYQMSDVAFVGGSLVDTGCQNVLEPAAMGIPVLVGPSQFNFQTICQQLEQAGALITVQDEYELASKVVELLKDKQQRGEMAAAGLTVINENKGALEKTITILDKLIR